MDSKRVEGMHVIDLMCLSIPMHMIQCIYLSEVIVRPVKLDL